MLEGVRYYQLALEQRISKRRSVQYELGVSPRFGLDPVPYERFFGIRTRGERNRKAPSRNPLWSTHRSRATQGRRHAIAV